MDRGGWSPSRWSIVVGHDAIGLSGARRRTAHAVIEGACAGTPRPMLSSEARMTLHQLLLRRGSDIGTGGAGLGRMLLHVNEKRVRREYDKGCACESGAGTWAGAGGSTRAGTHRTWTTRSEGGIRRV